MKLLGMKTGLLFFLISTIIFYSCNSSDGIKAQSVPRDVSIDTITSYSQIFFDSLQMENFISRQQFHDSLKKRMRNFYNARNYQFAWFFKEGMADYASSFYDLYNDYLMYSQDSTLKNGSLKQLYDSLSIGNFKYDPHDSIVLNTELLLTAQFFRYSRRAYQGSNQLNAQELDWYIPRRKIDPSVFLDSILINKGKDLSKYEPVNRQYN